MLTQETREQLKRFYISSRGMMISQITTKVIAEYRNRRLESVKPATVYQELALLRRMFNVAIKEWEWLKDNPVSRLSFSVGNRNARDRWLTLEEEKMSLRESYKSRLAEIVINGCLAYRYEKR